MDQEKIFEELLQLLDKLSITVKYDRGNFQGGLVRYNDQNYFYMNRGAETAVKINIILTELKRLNIPEELLKPEIKNILSDLSYL